MTDPDYATAAARSKNRDALNAEIESYLADGTSAEWVERINAAEVPCGPIYAIDEIYRRPAGEASAASCRTSRRPTSAACCTWSASP